MMGRYGCSKGDPMAWRVSEQGVEGENVTSFAVVVLMAVATTFLLEATRLYLSFAFFNIEEPTRYDLLIPVGLAVPAIALGGLLVRFFGVRSTILVATAGLAVTRLAAQFWMSPDARTILASLAIPAWGWLALALFLGRREAAAFGFVIGLALDLAILIGFQTVDLPWMPDASAHITTILLAGVLAAGAVVAAHSQTWIVQNEPALPLFAVGAGIVVHHLVTSCMGLVATNASVEFPWAAGTLAAGAAAGLILAALVLARPLGFLTCRNRFVVVGLVALGGTVSLWLSWMRDGMWTLAGFVGIGALFAPMLVYALTSSAGSSGYARHSVAENTVWFTAGFVFMGAMMLVYFFVQNVTLAFGAAYAVVVVCALRAVQPGHERIVTLRSSVVIPLVMISILAVSTLWQVLTWSGEVTTEPLSGEITVMTYNIQAGFSQDDDFALAAIADTIEEADPDVVILQEVARGWPFTTGIDQLAWLSHRLEMNYVFGQSDPVRLWSVSILTKSSIADVFVEGFQVPNFDRGVTAAVIATEGERTLWVYGTHFAAPRGAEAARVAEARQLLNVWNSQSPAVIGGDFNADAESQALRLLRASGLVDVGLAYGTEEPTFSGNRRIDHLLVTTGMQVVDVRVIDNPASDHNPVVTTIVIQDRNSP